MSTLNLSQQEFEDEARMALAVKLFESGRLTSGQAASWVNMPCARFLLECSAGQVKFRPVFPRVGLL